MTKRGGDPQPQARIGVAYALAAFGMWGLNPLYFKQVSRIGPLEVLSHRIVWSIILLAILLTVFRRWTAVGRALASRRTAGFLLATTLLLAGNWLIYIWAVEIGRVLETSLGYFINPLVNVLLGAVFLRERLRPVQAVAVGCAAAGMLILTLGLGDVPWIGLTLAISFGIYGLLRKVAAVASLDGLFIETCLVLPPAAIVLAYLGAAGIGSFGTTDPGFDLMLMLSGPVTALPLLCFNSAARRLSLTSLGFLQYLSPSGHLLLAVFAFGEHFTTPHLLAFACIWTGIAVFSLDSLRAQRRLAAAARASDAG